MGGERTAAARGRESRGKSHALPARFSGSARGETGISPGFSPEKKQNLKKNARWWWHLQVHHPRRPGVPATKILISKSKNGFPKTRLRELRSRNRAVWICGIPFFLSPIAATGWNPLSSNIIIGHTTFSGEPRLRRRGLCEIPT